MKMMEYWPSLPNMRQGIRTEAEELSDHTLLAVHEPARILRMNTDGSPLAYETEEQLLKHFLEVQRPLPIIGNTGVGKSHIIRWWDANLRIRPEYKNKQWVKNRVNDCTCQCRQHRIRWLSVGTNQMSSACCQYKERHSKRCDSYVCHCIIHYILCRTKHRDQWAKKNSCHNTNDHTGNYQTSKCSSCDFFRILLMLSSHFKIKI